ncbi:type 4a pilus biogenesis protein PilO [Halobacteriovorax sp. GB3]|uniref:type 4a pilus biogenesis protein PilO n=1 Tax=Halobacteriovorax sp. GB3 TaxID=2719615 RepID=UPI002361F1C7|nr:type 4a pilus biogenesis protein PilO [Halobacteriovorax sp. GB3]MDD0854600.1 type 4a pilus biogenesis protein PilO [Halobacteriovorax sp. GB3]
MKLLIKNLHVFLLLYLGFGAYEKYIAIEERKVNSTSEIPTIEQRIKKSQKKKTDIENYMKEIEDAKKRIELVAIEVEKIQKKLPSSISDASNLEFIKTIAETLNVKNIYLSPRSGENHGFYNTKIYEFKGSGTFLQFLIFLEKISEAEQLLNVSEITISKGTSPRRGRFQEVNFEAKVEAYQYNDNHKEDRGIDKIESEFKSKKGRG